MHDSEFEKQVRQKMQELKFAPGSDVWTRVQADIQKKKRRRPVVLWFLLAGLLVGGSWVVYSGVLDGEKSIHAETTSINKTNGSPDTEKTTESANTEKINGSSNTEETTGTADTERTNEPTNTEKTNESTNTGKTTEPTNTGKTKESFDPEKTNAVSKKDQPSVTYPDNSVIKEKIKDDQPVSNPSLVKSDITPHQSPHVVKTGKKDSRKTNNPAPEVFDQTTLANKQPVTNRPTLEENDVAKSPQHPTSDRPVQTSETNTGAPVTNKKEDVVAVKDNAPKENNTAPKKEETATPKDETAKSKNEETVTPKDETATLKKDETAVPKDETATAKKEETVNPKDNPKDEITTPKKDEPATLKKDESLATNKKKAPTKKDESVAMKNKNQQNAAAAKARWQLGVTAGAGVSDLGRQLFKPATVADFALSNTPMSPGPNAPYRRPSDVTAGQAWHAGAYISRNVGKKLALKLGLNYELYSNNIQVGSQVNSARFVNQGTDMKMVEEYYTIGTTTNYNNKYHFVSAPLSLQWKVFERKKYGIVWENGINVSRLVNTTALHFDGISGTYYKDDNIFKKTQLMLSSSVLFTIKSKNNLQLYAGPHVQYGISNLVNENAGSNRHLRYAGLKLMAGFNKK
jgi:hypothetical protein